MPGAGLTLIELVVAMTIAVVTLAVNLPLFPRGSSATQIERAIRALSEDLRAARSDAITGNRPVTFRMDVEQRLFGHDGTKPIPRLDDDIRLSLVTVEERRIDQNSGGIRFFPDGSSTGGSVVLARGQMEDRIIVDWLTGQVSVLESQER